MALNSEQAEKVRQQFIKQIESNFPPEQKDAAIAQIRAMSNDELEDFIMRNNEVARNATSSGPSEEKCVFCSIIEEKIPSYKIDENKKNIAILEINPLSRGHVIILPKAHTSTAKMNPSALTLAKKIAKRVKEKLKSEDVKIETSSLMDHSFVNVIPLYKETPLKKYHAEEKELAEIQQLIKIKPKKKREPKPKSKTEIKDKHYPLIKKRIP